MKAKPKQRYFFSCGWKNRAASPASQSGSVRGCCSRTWAKKNCQGRHGHVLPLLGVAHELQGRPVVPGQPDQVGEEEKQGDGAADPGPLAGEQPALPGQQQPGHDRGAKEEHAVLVEQRHAGQDAERDPELAAAAVDHAQQQPGAAHPAQGLEGVHRVEAADGQVDGRHAAGQRGQELGEARAAHLFRQPAAEPRQRRHGQRRHQAQHEQRIAEHRAQQAQEQDRQGRVVDIAPGQMVAAGDVVELVAEHAEAAGEQGRELDGHDPQRDPEARRQRRHESGKLFRSGHPSIIAESGTELQQEPGLER